MSTPNSILIVNPFGIGDVLFTTPLVRAVGRAFPGSRLAYLCNRRTETILRGNPHLSELFVYERDEVVRLWRTSRRAWIRQVAGMLSRLRRGRFDLVIDLSLGERYSGIMRLLGVRRRVGFNYRGRGRFLSATLTIDGYHERHVVDYYRRLLSFVGIAMDEGDLECRVSEDDERWADAWMRQRGLDGERPLVGLVPAGGVSWGEGAPFRRWSAEGFAEVGDRLAACHGAKILLFGEAADHQVCSAVAGLMRAPVVDVSGQTTLGRFISLLKRLDLVVCNDGGPLHLAVSQRTKTVSIFGPVDPRVYGPYPYNPQRHRVVIRRELLCRPCYHRFKLPPCPYERACLTEVEPDDVVRASEALLGDSAAAGAAPHVAR
jgi:ADP-heptose:LPS heptosyltransferase